jgi:hypothetical protein
MRSIARVGGRLMLKRIDIVAMYVREWMSAVRWYEDALGFSKVYVEGAR